jgi:CRISPR type III-A-associated protein Csm2
MSITVPDFLDSEGYIRPELLDKEALVIAGEFKNTKGLTTHQVRRFYDEVKSYKDRLDKGEPYKRIKPLIIMLKSKAKYAATKKPKEMSGFCDFINQSIGKIKTETGNEVLEKKRFDAFCLFFEAIYGFAELKNS